MSEYIKISPEIRALGREAEREIRPYFERLEEICDRNMIEGEFGTGKRAYGLNRIMAHLRETSFCVIGVALLCMNLTKRLRSLCLDLFAGLMQILCSIDRLSAIA